MKQADVKLGSTYLTYIGGDLARVEVIGVVPDDKRTRYRVRRVGETTPLPKPRTAAALRTA